MRWFRRRSSRSRAPESSRPSEPTSRPIVAGFVSSGYEGETFLGKRVVRIGDPELWAKEDAMRAAAEQPLAEEYESRARTLTELVVRFDSLPAGAGTDVGNEIREMGAQLCAQGGSDLMKQVAFRVAVLSQGRTAAPVRMLEMVWDGICGWRR